MRDARPDRDVEAGRGELEGLTAGAKEAERLLGVMEELGLVVKNGRGEFELTSEAIGGMADETKDVAAAYDLATRSATGFTAAITALNEILSGRASMRDYEAAVDAASKALKENGKNLDINTEKGRQNQAALDAIADTTARVMEGLSKSNRLEFMQGARDELIAAAVAFGMTEKAARRYADSLGLIDRTTPKLNIDLGDAEGKVKRLGQLFNSLPDDIQTHIRAGDSADHGPS